MILGCLEWGAAGRALTGELESGDHYAVRECPDGILVAVVDGLGHGLDAARAARRALSIFEATRAGETLISMTLRCQEALVATRGVVMSIARFSAHAREMVWLGVGNVQGLLLRCGSDGVRRQPLIPRGGVVGGKLPALAASIIQVWHGDTLVLATDGISERFTETMTVDGSPQETADRILEAHGKNTDDALVFVARYINP